MMPSLSLLAVAVAAALTLFGCEEMERGPSSPEPPKTAASASVSDDAVSRSGAVHLPL